MVKCGVLVALVALVHFAQCSQIVPPLYRYDDFFRCQREDPSGVYCFVKVVFKENQDTFDSPRIVSDFRHNLLDWGICVNNCQREMSVVPAKNHKRLYQFKFPINYTYILPKDLFGTDLDNFKLRYSALINICVNNRLEQKYNLSQHAYSEIEYCTTRDDLESSKKTLDLPKTMFYLTVFTLVSLFVGANVTDWIGHDHAKEHIIVTSFSVRRNWSRLTEQPKSELYRNFGYIDGIRVYASVFLIIMHCAMYSGVFPVANPEYSEQVWLVALLGSNSFKLSLLYSRLRKLCLPLLASAYIPTFIFYQYDIPRSSWMNILHNFLYRNVGVAALCVCFIECFRNPPGQIRAHLSSVAMTSLGKLSYNVYVLHIPVIRLILNMFSPSFKLSLVSLLWIPQGVAVISYFVGFVAFLLIEQPVGILLKHRFVDQSKPKLA
ncbi:hypothetical protein pipiens_008969 [Culex pipiens pipiens]|uniref:Acyltransferase 3 domain-containing protein n=1 Tax=Culex pipiens pipiens TaxID=38569 RepID=A0ABD1DFH4_CULPP